MKYIYTAIFAIAFIINSTPAYTIARDGSKFLPPEISTITTTTASVSVLPNTSMGLQLSDEQKLRLYFEYHESRQVCIMIYPTPEHCLPKKTPIGQTTVTLRDLKPNTQYSISFKGDNTIMCVTTPCPGNEFQSDVTTFTTLPATSSTGITLSRNLRVGSRGSDVTTLQDALRARGYFNTASTGYFGVVTLKAVKDYQRNVMQIPPTGFVGPLTRASLASTTSDVTFEGMIQAVSTACFADGECSVTIDGKKVVTTIGWSRDTVGTIKGTVTSIGDIETSKIGARAKVYAKQTADGYTLYGNAAYYIEVL